MLSVPNPHVRTHFHDQSLWPGTTSSLRLTVRTSGDPVSRVGGQKGDSHRFERAIQACTVTLDLSQQSLVYSLTGRHCTSVEVDWSVFVFSSNVWSFPFIRDEFCSDLSRLLRSVHTTDVLIVAGDFIY